MIGDLMLIILGGSVVLLAACGLVALIIDGIKERQPGKVVLAVAVAWGAIGLALSHLGI